MTAPRRLAAFGLAILLGMMLCGLALESAPAFATSVFTLESSFGAFGSSDGDFNHPANVAVQQSSGDLFVADEGNSRVQVFGPKGSFVTEITGVEVPGGGGSFGEISGVAVDNSTSVSAGDVYVVTRSRGVVDKFRPKGADSSEGYEYVCQIDGFAGGCTPGEGSREFEDATVTVDGTGNVYIGQVAGPVEEFNAEGDFIATLGPTILFTDDVAVNAMGSAVYVASEFGTVAKLTVEPSSHTVKGEMMLAEEEATAVAVDQATGDVFIDHGPHGIDEYEEAATDIAGEPPLEEFAASGQISHESVGIAYSTHGNGVVYITEQPDKVLIYASTVTPGPEAECSAPKEILPKEAKLDCTIDPDGKPLPWHFEYREAPARPVTWVTTPGGTATSSGSVEEAIEQLNPETEYVYRVVIGSTTSPPVRFNTLPAVPGLTACNAASGVSGEHATLEASLLPFESTEYRFEYGASVLYGLATSEGTSGASAGPVTVSALATGLEPHTEYDCRLSANDAEGTSYGANGVFKTPLVRPAVNDRPLSATTTRTSAVLKGTINPEKSPTKYRFVYVNGDYYNSTAKNRYYAGGSTPEVSAGEAFKDESVESPQISGLGAGTVYDYALEATNEAGTEIGPNYKFATAPGTPPVVGGGEVSFITQTSATISDTVVPEGLPTTYELDLGTDQTYGGARIFGQVVGGYETIAIEAQALAPGTTYYYRILATNEDGTTEGAGETFATLGVASPVTAPAAPPQLTVPSIAFPTEQGRVIRVSSKKKSGKAKKRRRTKAKGRRKAKGR